jgi:hypothetical protein
MKSHITVILDHNSEDLFSQLKRALEPHRLDENDIRSIQNHHWDYWFFPGTSALNDPELKRRYPNENPDVLANSSYIKNLPKDYATSGIFDLDGRWINLQDFGWAMINEPSIQNTHSLKKWVEECNSILEKNKEEICVQVIVHS